MTRDLRENTPRALSGARQQEATEPLHARLIHTCCSCGNHRDGRCVKTQQNCTQPISLSTPQGPLSCVIVEQVLIGPTFISLLLAPLPKNKSFTHIIQTLLYPTQLKNSNLCTARLHQVLVGSSRVGQLAKEVLRLFLTSQLTQV